MHAKSKTEICCIGHITLDKVVTPQKTVFMPGGTSFYFSNAIKNMPVSYELVTAIAEKEMVFVDELRQKGLEILVFKSAHTVYFENIYGENQDNRIQKVTQKADPFTPDALAGLDAHYFHLGPLLADDISLEVIQSLARRGIVSLDVQGLLREVRGTDVHPIKWTEHEKALSFVGILKANETEMEVLTGTKDIAEGAQILADLGVKEVIITLGSMGSVILSKGQYYIIPSYQPINGVVDATGCGDTYMAGYLYQRSLGKGLQESGEFGAAMATLNIQSYGPFMGTEEEVLALLQNAKKKFPVLNAQ